MEIKNKNFICSLMNRRDIEEAFIIPQNVKVLDFIYSLISSGYITKKGDRYYIPTQKLLDEAFLPPSGFVLLEDHQRRFLNANSSFYYKSLAICFGNEVIVDRLIKNGMLRLESDKRYRKGSELDDILAEGQEIIKL